MKLGELEMLGRGKPLISRAKKWLFVIWQHQQGTVRSAPHQVMQQALSSTVTGRTVAVACGLEHVAQLAAAEMLFKDCPAPIQQAVRTDCKTLSYFVLTTGLGKSYVGWQAFDCTTPVVQDWLHASTGNGC